ncbi:MAG: response regulator [Oscillospiraceae bacterium]|nr:response regulator [Oscillospiraceae bacterium]
MGDRVRVFLVEDDGDFAFLLGKMLEKDSRLEYLGYAAGRADGVSMVVTLKPDIILMDLSLTDNELDGIEAAREMRIKTQAKVLLITSFEQHNIMVTASKRAFASGYVFKSNYQNLADTIYATAISTTPQEGFIRELILSDLSFAERSVLLDIINGDSTVHAASSLKTIANQKTSIFKKLGLKNTNELVSVFKGWL